MSWWHLSLLGRILLPKAGNFAVDSSIWLQMWKQSQPQQIRKGFPKKRTITILDILLVRRHLNPLRGKSSFISIDIMPNYAVLLQLETQVSAMFPAPFLICRNPLEKWWSKAWFPKIWKSQNPTAANLGPATCRHRCVETHGIGLQQLFTQLLHRLFKPFPQEKQKTIGPIRLKIWSQHVPT